MVFTQIKMTSQSEHQRVWDLLPWYINRSLDPVEHAIVKNHIKTCITCRIELSQQERLFREIQQTDLLQQVSQASFAQLKKRIETRPEVYVSGNAALNKDLIFFPFQIRFLSFAKYTALAASLLFLAVPFMLNSLTTVQPEIEGSYRTLASSTESADNINNVNNVVRIVFADHPDSEQIDAVVYSVSGHIIKGPSPNGVYEVRIGDHQTDSHQVNDAIFRLREHSSVIFAELAQGLSVSE